MKVLIVDDDVTLLRSIQRALRGYSIEVIYSSSPHHGLSLLETKAFDVVISDLKMPRMNGIELLSRVRFQYPTTRRILMSGMLDLNGVIRAVNDCDISNIIRKPFYPAEIMRVLGTPASKQNGKVWNIDDSDCLEDSLKEAQEWTKE